METLIQSKHANLEAGTEEAVETIEDVVEHLEESKEASMPLFGESSIAEVVTAPVEKSKTPKKLVEDEARRVGRIGKDVWAAYISSAGGPVYWAILILALILASLDPVVENGWIK
jgi:hypothetical protein